MYVCCMSLKYVWVQLVYCDEELGQMHVLMIVVDVMMMIKECV